MYSTLFTHPRASLFAILSYAREFAVPIIRKHTLSIASGKSTSSLSQEGRWKRSINRTGVIPVATKPAWLLAHRLCQACVAQVRSPGIPLVCLFLLYPRQEPNHSWIPFFYASDAFCP